MIFSRSSKNFDFFVLTNELYPDIVLTITNTKEQCREYYNNYLRLKHLHTFKPFCEQRSLNPNSLGAWKEYYKERISSAEENTYKMSKVSFNKDQLAALMRSFSSTPLIGCSFESEFEHELRKLQEETSSGS